MFLLSPFVKRRLPFFGGIALVVLGGCSEPASDGNPGVTGRSPAPAVPDAGERPPSRPPTQGTGGAQSETRADASIPPVAVADSGPPMLPPDAQSDAADGRPTVATDPGSEGDGTVTITSPFQRAPETVVRDNVPKGRVIRFDLSGADSKVFPGGYTRASGVYLPPGYVSGTEIPFMVAHDAFNFGYFGRLVTILDNMIADGRLPAMAVVGASPGNRSVEYNTVFDSFARFVETELLPEAKRQAKMVANVELNLTEDPEGRGTFGGSSGGSCAFIMGWFGNYRRLLTVSGSFTPLQRSAEYPTGAAEFHNGLIARTPTKPLRVFLHAGSNDAGPVNGGPNWKVANDRMAAVLKEKGYHYRYVYGEGAGHTDGAAMNAFLPEAMRWLWRGYPIKK